MKNADLFKKTLLDQNSNQFQSAATVIDSNMTSNNSCSALLNRITEISERLEKVDSSDTDETQTHANFNHNHQPLRDHQQFDKSHEPCKNEGFLNNSNFEKLYDDENYKRVTELYNQVFPSQKLKCLQYESNYDINQKGVVNDCSKIGCNDQVINKTVKPYNPLTENYCTDPMKCNCVKPTGLGIPQRSGNKMCYSSNKQNLPLYTHGDFIGCSFGDSHRSCNSPVMNCKSSKHDSSQIINKECFNASCRERKQDLIPAGNVTAYNKRCITFNDDRPIYDCVENPGLLYNEKYIESHNQSTNLKFNKNDKCCHPCHFNDNYSNNVESSKEKSRNLSKFKNKCHSCNDDKSESNSSYEEVPSFETTVHSKYKKKKKKVTVDELYKIVKLQNEQINLLQKQIDRLLEQNYNIKERLLEQNYNIKKNAENKQITTQRSDVESPPSKKCSCKIDKSNDKEDKFTAQKFAFSVVQENSKIERQDICDIKSNAKNCTNVSIGVMTSFVEITQKFQGMTIPQQFNGVYDRNQNVDDLDFVNNANGNDRGRKDVFQQRGKKITENSTNRFGQNSNCPAVAEESFTLNEVDLPALPVLVNEHVPSPQCSVHLDIQDYGSTTTCSSSSDGSDDYSDHHHENNTQEKIQSDDNRVGWTLYDNVVEQVNKILLGNASKQAATGGITPTTDDVRMATLQQLKKLGVSFVENDSSAAKKVTFDPVNSPAVDNFGVQDHCQVRHNGAGTNHIKDPTQLNYLSEEQILQAAMNIMNKRKGAVQPASAHPPVPPAYGPNTDLSFATMRYLERYQLLPGQNSRERVYENKQPQTTKFKKHKHHKTSHLMHRQQYNEGLHQQQYNEQRPQNFLSNKILDITALKQQPKLL
ncbi:uncharacterized protein LOC142329313 isoform X2 [Lycorma delicatula]